jgi:hypothetical protein
MWVSSAAAAAAGTIASAGGTRRPPMRGTHAGNTTPQGRTNPMTSDASASGITPSAIT